MSKLLDGGTDATSLVVRRIFDAPRAKVFRAFTDPRRIALWMGPNEAFTIPTVNVDLRIGGRYDIVMQSPDGERHHVGGEYVEIVAPERLVHTWAWASTPDRVSRVTVDLSELDGGRTQLTLTHDRLFDAAVRDRHQHGWIGSLDRLARLFASET
jgi:uncharacterized protein YndB with AHSA1/START domain